MNGFIDGLPCLNFIHKEDLPKGRSFEEIARQFAADTGTVVLMSGTDLDCARYNILAIDPWLVVQGRNNRFEVSCFGHTHEFDTDPFSLIDRIISRYALDAKVQLSQWGPVCAGLFGYFSYDLKDDIEVLPQTCMDSGLPDICLYAPSMIIIQDRHRDHHPLSLFIPILGRPDEPSQDRNAYIESKLEWLRQKLSEPVHGDDGINDPGTYAIDREGFSSSFTKPQYLEAVRRIIAYLKAGDIYQANLSQQFRSGFKGDPFTLFVNLFKQNPAPFFAYVHAGSHTIVSTSPERFIKREGNYIETRPIKGTLARGRDASEDQERAKILSASVKDDAELTMIVDLMRNDLSRVTRHDSVIVREHKRLEPYDNVFHLVSVVEGELRSGTTPMDIIKATFPGGSITGCPKIRSMEIIDELEPVRRHVYTGSIGYISFHDTLDLSIAIRTATVFNQSICFSVGGGIVYDSDPEKEYQETLDKGKTIMDTLTGAHEAVHPTPRSKVWLNGKICPDHDALIPIGSTGFQYGAGIFETIRVENGRPVRLDHHITRMTRSWETLFDNILPKMSWDTIIDQLLRENHLASNSCMVKLMVFEDKALNPSGISMAAMTRPYVHRLEMLEKEGLDLWSCPRQRISHLADHKSMNYLFYYLAGQSARENGRDEAIIFNPDGSVSETNTCSVMVVSGKRVQTPESEHVLPGVTQSETLSILETMGYEITRSRLSLEDLLGASCVLLTNSLMGAVPVLSIDDFVYGSDALDLAKNICHDLNHALFSGDEHNQNIMEQSLESDFQEVYKSGS
ncbi:MAG: aminodeoxychorismate synthase component I [Desulfobacteraceae bacterium]|nr:MAG: aminodeoxychorismate synthase component I [Desulfobacteraceae bacterium]